MRFLRMAEAPALFASLSCASCAAQQSGSDPQSALHAYARALIEGRADVAYGMLSDDARRGMSLQALRRIVTDDPDGVAEVGRALDRSTAPPEVAATVYAPSGEELHLVLENGSWRVDGSSIDLYPQDTPRRAIEGFVRAVEHKRYDVLLQYVPDAHKDGIDAAKLKEAWEGRDRDQVTQVVSALKHSLSGATIEQTGDRAAMPFGAGTMLLVRERGLWKIENFD